jgi:hypothetical protein
MQLHLPLFALIAASSLSAQNLEPSSVLDDGLRSGPGYFSPQVGPDGRLVGSGPAIRDQVADPSAPDGSVGGPLVGPLQEGCVSLNPSGGTLSVAGFATAWFLHRVVAPRKMSVVSFDFFCRMSTSTTVVNTGLFKESGGLPASTPWRTSRMSVGTSPGWYRSTLSSSEEFNKGQVFYIGFQVPSSAFKPALTGGNSGTYYWNTSSPWKGPYTGKFGWRVNCYAPSYAYATGIGCNTQHSTGMGQGRFAASLNANAVTNNSAVWVKGAQFMHRVVATRDFYVNGVSFLSRVSSTAAEVTCEMRLGDGPSSSPGTLVRSGKMYVDASSSWNRTSWAPYLMRRGSIFYLGYTTPSSVSLYISTDDGYPTTYHWRSSSASSWSNAVTTRKFALKVHSQYVDSLNLTAAGNDSTLFAADATFAHKIWSYSDQWVSGFGFLCRVSSGTENVRFVLYAADSTGKPSGSPLRAVTRLVNTTSQWVDVHFTPLLMPRGTEYFVGYETPSNSRLRPAAQGSNLQNSVYYWKAKSSKTWNGYFNTTPFAFRVYDSRMQANPYTTSNAINSFASDARFAFRTVAADDMWVDGFELLCSVPTGSEELMTWLFLADGPAGAPGRAVKWGSMSVNSSHRWNYSSFHEPYLIQQGTPFYVVLATPKLQTIRLRASSGTATPYHWRKENSSSWTGPVTSAPIAFKVRGSTGVMHLAYHGEAELGQTLRINLIGASPNKIYGLVLGLSDSQWGPIPLPWEIPLWSGCRMYASYDLVLAAGSTDPQGTVTQRLPIPNSVQLLRMQFYNQFWVLEQNSPLEMSWSSGGHVVIGG